MNEWITPDELKEHHDNGYSAGVAHERERIVSLLKKEARHRKQISESIAMDEYMSRDDSESEWWASVVLDKFADALIKGENQ